jgi:hypothetical protein
VERTTTGNVSPETSVVIELRGITNKKQSKGKQSGPFKIETRDFNETIIASGIAPSFKFDLHHCAGDKSFAGSFGCKCSSRSFSQSYDCGHDEFCNKNARTTSNLCKKYINCHDSLATGAEDCRCNAKRGNRMDEKCKRNEFCDENATGNALTCYPLSNDCDERVAPGKLRCKCEAKKVSKTKACKGDEFCDTNATLEISICEEKAACNTSRPADSDGCMCAASNKKIKKMLCKENEYCDTDATDASSLCYSPFPLWAIITISVVGALLLAFALIGGILVFRKWVLTKQKEEHNAYNMNPDLGSEPAMDVVLNDDDYRAGNGPSYGGGGDPFSGLSRGESLAGVVRAGSKGSLLGAMKAAESGAAKTRAKPAGESTPSARKSLCLIGGRKKIRRRKSAAGDTTGRRKSVKQPSTRKSRSAHDGPNLSDDEGGHSRPRRKSRRSQATGARRLQSMSGRRRPSF